MFRPKRQSLCMCVSMGPWRGEGVDREDLPVFTLLFLLGILQGKAVHGVFIRMQYSSPHYLSRLWLKRVILTKKAIMASCQDCVFQITHAEQTVHLSPALI